MSLPEAMVDRILESLELTGRPEPTGSGLSAVYSAWCRHVPFDNIRKLIHVRRGDPGVLPGDDAGNFFDGWLRFGAGGTCWAGNGALGALLVALPSPHEPAPAPGTSAAAAHSAWSAAGHWRDGHWHIRWRPLHKLDGLDCRIDRSDAEAATFSQFHEQSMVPPDLATPPPPPPPPGSARG